MRKVNVSKTIRELNLGEKATFPAEFHRYSSVRATCSLYQLDTNRKVELDCWMENDEIIVERIK